MVNGIKDPVAEPSERAAEFEEVFMRAALILLVALLLSETTINYMTAR
jgi:hypothetical protein